MRCKRCNTEGVIYRQINHNGAKVIVERCPKCRTNPNTGKAFLSLKDYDWESLPLFDDYSNSEPCQFRGCKNKGVEWHHYAPRHLFDDAEDWPMGWLCRVHHNLWHKKTQTGSYITQRKHEHN